MSKYIVQKNSESELRSKSESKSNELLWISLLLGGYGGAQASNGDGIEYINKHIDGGANKDMVMDTATSLNLADIIADFGAHETDDKISIDKREVRLKHQDADGDMDVGLYNNVASAAEGTADVADVSRGGIHAVLANYTGTLLAVDFDDDGFDAIDAIDVIDAFTAYDIA